MPFSFIFSQKTEIENVFHFYFLYNYRSHGVASRESPVVDLSIMNKTGGGLPFFPPWTKHKYRWEEGGRVSVKLNFICHGIQQFHRAFDTSDIININLPRPSHFHVVPVQHVHTVLRTIPYLDYLVCHHLHPHLPSFPAHGNKNHESAWKTQSYQGGLKSILSLLRYYYWYWKKVHKLYAV